MQAPENPSDRAALVAELQSLREKLADYEANEASAERLHERYARILLDEMYQFVGLLDGDGRLVDVNKAALEGAGITAREVLGQPFWHAHWWQVSPETAEQCRQDCLTVIREKEFLRREVDVYGELGGREVITIDFSLNPTRDQAGRLWIVAEGRNITEKKEAEAEIARKTEQLRDAHERLKELDRLKTEFFANVSHELRTPLSLILGPVRQHLARNDIDPKLRENLSLIERNATLLLQQVNNLLDLARLEASGMKPDYARLDLAHLLRTMASNFELLANDREITYDVRSPETLPAEVDSDKLQRIILNLLSNAFKFTPLGGTIRCSLEAEGEHAVLTIEDSGPGIPKHLREAVFERFRQVEGGATRKAGGTGLGLSIAREFTELHGGRIALSHGDLNGARFVVRMPVRAPEGTNVAEWSDAHLDNELSRQATEELRTAMPPGTPAGETASEAPANEYDSRAVVLVVEDNPDMNAFLANALHPRYRVARAFNGREGLEEARRLHPEAIVTDIMMPEMSGDQMVQRLREDPDLAEIPVVVLTAKADDRQRVQLLEQSVEDHMTKPFQEDELLARVGGVIQRRRDTIRKLRELNATLEQRVAERTRQVRTQAERLRHLVSELNTTEQRERRRLAQALHENLQQMLVSAKMGVERAMARSASNPPRDLERTLRILEESIQTSRGLTVELGPPVLYDRGLGAAMNWLKNHMDHQHGLQVQLTVEPGAEPPDQDVQTFIFSAVQELLLNVVKHAETDHARLTIRRANSMLAITVEDEGVGCSPDRFNHSDETARFGLFNIRERLQVLGGTLSIDAAPAGGLRVNMLCPFEIGASDPAFTGTNDGGDSATQSSPKSAPQSSRKPAPQRPIRIMIVDDHRVVREGLASILNEEADIEVVGEAGNGQEAVDQVESAKPDVVLMDVTMPVMDGVEATRRIREKKPDVRVIGLSMHEKSDLAETMLNAGAEQYLTKGGRSIDLVNAIRAPGTPEDPNP